MKIFNDLPTAFPWYDKKEKQQRYRENAAPLLTYKLLTPSGRLLPFQFEGDPAVGAPTVWKIYGSCGNEIADISSQIATKLFARELEDGLRVYYKGDTLTGLDIPEGTYYSTLTFPGEKIYYSEEFWVKEDLTNVLTIDYWNETDLKPVAYNAIGWKQKVYLDTFVHTSEPEVEEDGERDGDDQLVPTFQKMIVKYRFTLMVPDFMKIALTSMQLHDNIEITTNGGVRTGRVDRVTTSATVDVGGAYSTVDVVMEQLIMTRDSCAANMVLVNENPWAP